MAYKKLKYWFDEALVRLLAEKICLVDPQFQSEAFIQSLIGKLDHLELKDRIQVIAEGLFNQFDRQFEVGLNTLTQILGPENEAETGMFTNYYWIMPIAKYVEEYGQAHFDQSIQAIEEITKRNTGEYTIRPFLETHTEKALSQMRHWSLHPNKHVRRLSSEGVRPRLPWAKKLEIFIQDPLPIIPILENLKDDPSKYVQKSVANTLNDILKDNPEIGKEVINNWRQGQIGKARKWIIKHALRNWLKREDDWALEVIEGWKS